MRAKSIIALAAALTVTAASAQDAQTMENNREWRASHPDPDRDYRLFKSQELSLDLFGSYIASEGKFTDLFDTNIRHGNWGGGAGVTYYFLRYAGIGTDFNISDHSGGDWKFDYWVGDLYLRLPLGDSGIAPYIYGSGGRSINPSWQWVYGFGPGVEFRFMRHVGLFTDARFLWSHESTALNTLTFRAGLRITF